MASSRVSQAKGKRALAKAGPHRRRESRPTGGGTFFRARPRRDVADVEHIRDVFRRLLEGTSVGRGLTP